MAHPPLDIPASEAEKLVREGRGVFVDCREPWEFELAHIAGSTLIPLGELAARVAEVPRDREVVVLCHHGVRSRHGALVLRGSGLAARSLAGGIDAWSTLIDPSVPRY